MQEAFLAVWRTASRFVPENAARRARGSSRSCTAGRSTPCAASSGGAPSSLEPRRRADRRGRRRGRLVLRLQRERVQSALPPPSRRAAGGARARVLRRVQPVGARREARPAARYHQEQDVRGALAHARAARRAGNGDVMDSHDLTAAYALDALDPDEAEAYERHLGQCEELPRAARRAQRGRRGARLRRRSRPRRRRGCARRSSSRRPRSGRTSSRSCAAAGSARGLAVAAAAVACIAVGLAVSLSQSSKTRSLDGHGRARTGKATLHISGLLGARRAGRRTRPGSSRRGKRAEACRPLLRAANATVRLRGTVPRHAVVAVTRERAGGVKAPTMTPILSASA